MSKVSMMGSITCQDGKGGKGDEMEAVLMTEPPQMALATPLVVVGVDV